MWMQWHRCPSSSSSHKWSSACLIVSASATLQVFWWSEGLLVWRSGLKIIWEYLISTEINWGSAGLNIWWSESLKNSDIYWKKLGAEIFRLSDHQIFGPADPQFFSVDIRYSQMIRCCSYSDQQTPSFFPVDIRYFQTIRSSENLQGCWCVPRVCHGYTCGCAEPHPYPYPLGYPYLRVWVLLRLWVHVKTMSNSRHSSGRKTG